VRKGGKGASAFAEATARRGGDGEIGGKGKTNRQPGGMASDFGCRISDLGFKTLNQNPIYHETHGIHGENQPKPFPAEAQRKPTPNLVKNQKSKVESHPPMRSLRAKRGNLAVTATARPTIALQSGGVLQPREAETTGFPQRVSGRGGRVRRRGPSPCSLWILSCRRAFYPCRCRFRP